MPINDLGYRKWNGKPGGSTGRMIAITETGAKLALKSRWVKRTLFFAWLPILFWGVGLYLGEATLQGSFQSRRGDGESVDAATFRDIQRQARNEIQAAVLAERLRFLPGTGMLADALDSNDENEIRNIVWRWLLMTYFRYPQAVAMVFLIGFVVPVLISRDFRSRAFLLYFSRPIGIGEYILGKLAIPAVFLFFMSTLPALVLYVAGLAMSPDLSAFFYTWDVPFRILAATVVVVLPTASLAIALSSLTQESRFASFAWFAVWLLGHGAWSAVLLSQTAFTGNLDSPPEVNMKWWAPVSLYDSLIRVQNWIFGFQGLDDVWHCLLLLVLITIFSLLFFWRRIRASVNV